MKSKKEVNQKGENKKNSKKSTAKIVFDVIFYVLAVVIFAFLIYSLALKIKGEDSYPFFGYRGMIVQSPSMSFKNPANEEFLAGHDEQMQVEDLVFTRKLKSGEQPQIYDIVTFKRGNITVIHRVVEIYEYQGVTYYVTCGDAAPKNDTDHHTLDEITGIYAFSFGGFGKVVNFLQSKFGLIAMIAMLAILAIASVVLNYFEKEKKNNNGKQQKASNKPSGGGASLDASVEQSIQSDSDVTQQHSNSDTAKDEQLSNDSQIDDVKIQDSPIGQKQQNTPNDGE